MTVLMAPDDVDTLRDICGPPGDHPCYCEDVQALCDSHEEWRRRAAMNHGDMLDELHMVQEMLKTTLVTARNRLNEIYRLRDEVKDLKEGYVPRLR